MLDPQPFVPTTLAEAQRAMPFPVILPPTDVFPLRHILTKRGGEGPFGPEVRMTLGNLFSGAGFWVWESASRKRFGPNSQAVEIAGYPARVTQSVTNAGVPLVIASAYTGQATYTVLGSHVELADAESMLAAILAHVRR